MNYRGADILVRGEYYPGESQTFDHPGSPSEFLLQEILYKDIDVLDIINAEAIINYFFEYEDMLV